VGQWRPSPGPQVDQSFEPAINPQLIAEIVFKAIEQYRQSSNAMTVNGRLNKALAALAPECRGPLQPQRVAPT
jgi:hypothetical protein